MQEIKIYEKVQVKFVPLNEETVTEEYNRHAEPLIMEMLAKISTLPLKSQVVLVCNILTISGFTEKEIAKAMGISYKHYRNILWANRKLLEDKNNCES
jgi:DNA-directed RNA polymerase specialized sigma subunit